MAFPTTSISIILIFVLLQLYRSTADTYSAAVIEFHFKLGNTTANTENYVKILQSREASGLDIILFPEGCLNSAKDSIPVTVHPLIAPCQDTTAHRLLRDISCAVQVAKAYTVIDVMMKASCTLNDPCPPNQSYVVFNTAVVFDRTGAVIAK